MDSELRSVEELEARCEAVTAQRQALEEEERDLERALNLARERRDRERPDSLMPEDEKTLRRALTVVGELLANPDVLHGGFTLEDAEPDETDHGYFGPRDKQVFSVDIQAGLCLDVCPGLRIRVTLKTKNAKVCAIVREMLTSTEYVRDEDKHRERTYWNIDWDYHDAIEVRNPMTSEQYYGKTEL